MKEFEAVEVTCSEALEWEIVQVTFDSKFDTPERGELDFEWNFPMVTVSVNFEFSSIPKVEWNDGAACGGGGIKQVRLTRDSIFLKTEDEEAFSILFKLSDEKYHELTEYMKIIFRSTSTLELTQTSANQSEQDNPITRP